MKRAKLIPRGIRNCNPLNIRIGNAWLGEVYTPDDPDFEQFVSMEYGLRAACVLLRRYIKHYRRNTIISIISSWAPANENDTQRYIDCVSRLSGIPSDKELRYEDCEEICKIVDAMAFVECGEHVPMEKIRKGYSMA